MEQSPGPTMTCTWPKTLMITVTPGSDWGNCSDVSNLQELVSLQSQCPLIPQSLITSLPPMHCHLGKQLYVPLGKARIKIKNMHFDSISGSFLKGIYLPFIQWPKSGNWLWGRDSLVIQVRLLFTQPSTPLCLYRSSGNLIGCSCSFFSRDTMII